MGELDEQDGQWLPLAEAAPLLGQTVDGLRKQIRRGRREGRRANDGRWLARVQLGQDGAGRTIRPDGQPGLAMEPDGVHAELDRARTELAAAVARLEERDRHLADLRAEVAWLRSELGRQRWPGVWPAVRRWWLGEG